MAEDKYRFCRKCGRPISADEVGISKKLINRGTDKFFCIPCLAKAFDVEEVDIVMKIDFYKKMGCTLFH